MKAKKGQGLSINMLVIVALAVFVVFLVIGFVTGGWSYFAGMFRDVTPTGGEEAAITKCQMRCASWQAVGCPVGSDSGKWKAVWQTCHVDIDFNNDGIKEESEDGYGCRKTGCSWGPMVSAGECSC